MGTWVATIAETGARPDFWEIAQKHGVRASNSEVPEYALIDCDVGRDFQASIRLAEELSRDVGTTCIGFVVQTNADVHEVHAFNRGKAIRTLGYCRDSGGWLQVEGAAQPWEHAYFFDEDGSTSDETSPWPNMLWDDLTDEDIARYENGKAAGDASSVLDLMHPSSMEPMIRVCTFFGIQPDRPAGRWKRPSLLSRLLGRG
jgi:hypothetical protein